MSQKAVGVLPLDIFLCMLYNKDDVAIRKTIRPFLMELGKDFDCSDLQNLVDCLPLVGLRSVRVLLHVSLFVCVHFETAFRECRAMFFMLLVIDHKIRHWAMQYEVSSFAFPHSCCVFRKLWD
jgi:hypothetical protein